MNSSNRETAFQHTGAVEQDRPEQESNVAPMDVQLDHRYQDPLNKSNDSGLPETGQNPEFTGELQGRNELNQDTNAKVPKKSPDTTQKDIGLDPEGATQDQDPGMHQKENQNRNEDDPLAA